MVKGLGYTAHIWKGSICENNNIHTNILSAYCSLHLNTSKCLYIPLYAKVYQLCLYQTWKSTQTCEGAFFFLSWGFYDFCKESVKNTSNCRQMSVEEMQNPPWITIGTQSKMIVKLISFLIFPLNPFAKLHVNHWRGKFRQIWKEWCE